MTMHDNSRSRPGGAKSRLTVNFSEEMTCCGSKNGIFFNFSNFFEIFIFYLV
jgi:hypothetical protein